jgi:hypothetical protein
MTRTQYSNRIVNGSLPRESKRKEVFESEE